MSSGLIDWRAWAANACNTARPCTQPLTAACLGRRQRRDKCGFAPKARAALVTDPVTLLASRTLSASTENPNDFPAANDVRTSDPSLILPILHDSAWPDLDEQRLDALTDVALAALSPFRKTHTCLATVMIASPDLGLLESLKCETHSGWFVLENASPRHFHGLLLTSNRAELERALDSVAREHCLPRSRFRIKAPIGGWRSRWPHDIDANLRDVIAYALCVGRRRDKRDKRDHETPQLIDQWGAFEAVAGLADWALSVTPVTAPRVCGCGCRTPLKGRGDKRAATAACRKRMSRARRP